MISNENLAECWMEGIKNAIELNSNIEGEEDDELIFDKIDSISTYNERGILTKDKGLVIHIDDGSEIYITIQAYSERN